MQSEQPPFPSPRPDSEQEEAAPSTPPRPPPCPLACLPSSARSLARSADGHAPPPRFSRFLVASEALSTPAEMLCGGVSPQAKEATAETQELVQAVKAEVEEKEGRSFEVFNAVEFKTQMVAGINYFVKVQTGNDKYLHLRIHKSLPHENKPPKLTSYQSNKEKHEELSYF